MHSLPTLTSEDLIRVDWIIGETSLAFGLTLCPGKKAPGITAQWNRDLDHDLTILERIGVDVLAPLIPEAEMRMLGVPDLLDEIRFHHMGVEPYPFPDAGVPDDMMGFAAFVDRLVALLNEGERVVCHCRGGLGRAGLVASCVLLRMGRFQKAADAIAEVRRKRSPRAIETRAQERFVESYARHLAGGGR